MKATLKSTPKRRFLRVSAAAVSGAFVFISVISIADRIRSAPELYAATDYFLRTMSPEIGAETGNLALDQKSRTWRLDFRPAYSDHVQIVEDFKRMLDEHDLPGLKNYFVPTSKIRGDVDAILDELKTGDHTNRTAIDAAALQIAQLRDDATIAMYVARFVGEDQTILFDHFADSRRTLIGAAETATADLEKSVKELVEISKWNDESQSLKLDDQDAIDVTIMKATEACRKSRIAFVFIRASTPILHSSAQLQNLRSRFLKCEVQAEAIVGAIAKSELLSVDGYQVVPGVLQEYAAHMQERILRIREDSGLVG